MWDSHLNYGRFFICGVGVGLSAVGTSATTETIYIYIYDNDDDEGWAIGGMIMDRGNWITREKPAPVPTWLDLGLSPGHRGRKPATSRISYGTVPWKIRMDASK